jgi:hypothetical protein
MKNTYLKPVTNEFYTSFLPCNKTRFESSDNTVVDPFRIGLSNSDIFSAVDSEVGDDEDDDV